MSVIERVVAAVTPAERHEAREQARREAQALAQPGDWLSAVLAHHRTIEAAFAAAKAESDSPTRIEARKRLISAFTAHANAEESVLYPALARLGGKRHAGMAYAEHAATKMQLGELEILDPRSEDYLDKLETVREAVAQHMHEEEATWVAELRRKAGVDEQARLTRRFEEEYRRYAGNGAETLL